MLGDYTFDLETCFDRLAATTVEVYIAVFIPARLVLEPGRLHDQSRSHRRRLYILWRDTDHL
jgi:hypothetical protein